LVYLVSYDIEQDKIRTKLANLLLEFGLYRIQKSLFVGQLKGHLLKKIVAWVEENQENSCNTNNKVLILKLNATTLENALFLLHEAPAEWTEIEGKTKVLFF
jgi:CRISPR-associated endonuclease Cas2